MNYSVLIKKEPRPLLFAMTNSFFSCYGQSHFLALFSLIIFEQYKLTNTQFGTLYAAATLLTAFALPFIGPLVDTVDIRKYCLAISFAMALGFWLLLSTPIVAVLFIAIFLLRLCGQGLCTHVNGVSTARYFGKDRGKALSLTNTGFPIAEGLFTPLIAFFLSTWGATSTVYFLIALVAIFYFPLTFFLTKNITSFNKPNQAHEEIDQHTCKKSWTPREVLKHNVFYLLISHSVFPAFSLSGFLIYQISYAQTKGWPINTIAFAMSLFAVGRLLSAFITGPLVDKLGALKLFPYYQLPLAVAFFLFWYFESPYFAVLGLFLSGLTVGAAAPIKSALWAELYGVGHLGAIKSLFATIIVVVTSISPLFFGWMFDHNYQLILLVLLSVISLITTSLGTWAVVLYRKQSLA